MTVFPFTPSQNRLPPFSFSPVLDGSTYSASVFWNIFRQGWYITIVGSNNNETILTCPVIESPWPMATQSVSWDINNRKAIVQTVDALKFELGQRILFTIRGVSPDLYNGTYIMTVEGNNKVTYDLPNSPGGFATVQGQLRQDVNLVAGLFNSSLIFRNNSFEVYP